jgi:hypothetical protein
MLAQINQILNQAAARITNSIASFLPGLLAFVLVLAFTIGAAWIVAVMVRRSLRSVAFDSRVERWGFSELSAWSPAHSPSMLAARLMYWLVIIVGLSIGLSAIDATVTSTLVSELMNFLPHVIAAGVILVGGIIFARFLGRSVLISAVNMQVHSARLLSLGVKWMVMVLAGAMALDHLGIGGQIVRLAFGILFGGIVLALALAVGLGSKDMVSRSLERQVEKSAGEERASRVHHW